MGRARPQEWRLGQGGAGYGKQGLQNQNTQKPPGLHCPNLHPSPVPFLGSGGQGMQNKSTEIHLRQRG